MPGISDYNVCLSTRDDTFVPGLSAISRLIDYLDSKMYADGPDRDDSRLVLLPVRETNEWKNYLRVKPGQPVPAVSKRYVNLLYSSTANETLYRHYGELATLIDNITPKDASFVASLGRGTRKLDELIYFPTTPNEERRWLQYTTAHLLNGYHALWDRVWDNATQQKVWRLKATKGFTLMIGCKLNTKAPIPPLGEYLENLQSKPEFQEFMAEVGAILGNSDFELIGEHTG